MKKIFIVDTSAISAAGESREEVLKQYQHDKTCITETVYNDEKTYVGVYPKSIQDKIAAVKKENPKYRSLDEVVHASIVTVRHLLKKIGVAPKDLKNTGLNFGSSRGATKVLEKHHERFIITNKVSPLSSPTTSMGNLSTWIARDLAVEGPVLSHSITCSTALHSILNGAAWIRGGMADSFICGGAEAALSDFTIAQLKSLRIYAKGNGTEYPSRAFYAGEKKSEMVLGEGAGAAFLCSEDSPLATKAKAEIIGMGWAMEKIDHGVSLSENGDCLHDAMQKALAEAKVNPDLILTHAPGTKEGDKSEFNAIQKLFGKSIPHVFSNKWKVGHTLGASGILNIDLAVGLFEKNVDLQMPFDTYLPNKTLAPTNVIMVNATGFGGNAISIILKKITR